MTSFHTAQRRGFVKGGGTTYTCRSCGHLTRPTGQGDNDGVRMCSDCYDLSGEENHLSDCGCFYDKPQNILAMIDAVEAKTGNTKLWAHLKAEAQKIIDAETPAVTQAPASPTLTAEQQAVVAKIMKRAEETKEPCRHYASESGANTAAKKMAQACANHFAADQTKDAAPAEFFIVFIPKLGRWTFSINLTEVIKRDTSTGGYLGFCQDIYVY